MVLYQQGRNLLTHFDGAHQDSIVRVNDDRGWFGGEWDRKRLVLLGHGQAGGAAGFAAVGTPDAERERYNEQGACPLRLPNVDHERFFGGIVA